MDKNISILKDRVTEGQCPICGKKPAVAMVLVNHSVLGKVIICANHPVDGVPVTDSTV